MTSEEAKTLLRQYQDMSGRLRDMQQRMRDTPDQELVQQMQAETERVLSSRRRIQTTINSLTDEREKRVLELRYIDGLSWASIGLRMYMSSAFAHKVHGAALASFAKMYE